MANPINAPHRLKNTGPIFTLLGIMGNKILDKASSLPKYPQNILPKAKMSKGKTMLKLGSCTFINPSFFELVSVMNVK